MSKVALVSHDVQTLNGRAGGVAAFVTHFARLLKRAGEDVAILLTRQETYPVHVDATWRARYAEWGIELVEIHNNEPNPDRWCQPWTARLSEIVAPHLTGFDIAYFQDWANVAFHAARARRFSSSPAPILVTVLHGPSGWVRAGNQCYPEIPEDLHLDYIERYSARHSDFVVSPSRYMAQWLRFNGWDLPQEPAVLGLPYLAEPREPAKTSGPIRRIVFFGRLQTRKGVSLFVAALGSLLPELAAVEEIVFLGEEQEPGILEKVRAGLAPLRIVHIGQLDSGGAGKYLADHVSDSLVVIPSPADNFPYAVIEASSIPGINLICSQGGGLPEVLTGEDHLFEPYPEGLAQKLRERLREPAAPLRPYDAEAANARWLQFHRGALSKPKPERTPAPSTVDVCIPYFNKQQYLHQLLKALESQTTRNFGVIAINDGSEPSAAVAFDLLRDKYSNPSDERGWMFVTQPNSFVDAARNRAASLSNADYLFFIDADDVPAPHAIARMTEAIALSGDDCLVAGGILFDDDISPVGAPALAHYLPLGPDLVCGLLDPMVLGPSMIVIRRAAFEEIGGYRQVRGAAHEDWELQIRLVMAGWKVDVLPEFLLYFRKSESGLSRTSCEYDAKRRLIDTYEAELAKAGLRGLASTLIALLKRRDELEAAVKENEESRARRLHVLVGDMLRRRTERR